MSELEEAQAELERVNDLNQELRMLLDTAERRNDAFTYSLNEMKRQLNNANALRETAQSSAGARQREAQELAAQVTKLARFLSVEFEAAKCPTLATRMDYLTQHVQRLSRSYTASLDQHVRRIDELVGEREDALSQRAAALQVVQAPVQPAPEPRSFTELAQTPRYSEWVTINRRLKAPLCSICGVLALDTPVHTAWHQRIDHN